MLPLIGLAATFVPELIRLIAGDKAGTVATTVAQAVTDLAGTDDPVAARQKLAADRHGNRRTAAAAGRNCVRRDQGAAGGNGSAAAGRT